MARGVVGRVRHRLRRVFSRLDLLVVPLPNSQMTRSDSIVTHLTQKETVKDVKVESSVSKPSAKDTYWDLVELR